MTATATAILGIPVDNLSLKDAVSRIMEMIGEYAVDQRPRYVATMNIDFITNIHSWRMGRARHPELMHILRKADMVTADGMPVVWASRWLGSPLPMRVAGSDLVPRLVEAAADAGKSVYFLGGKRFEMTAHRAARALKKRLPGLRVAGVDAPWVHTSGEALAQAEEEDLRIVERINAVQPDILLISFGSPKQEIWFDRNRHRLKVPLAMGVGATFEFLAGTTARAPQWMQQSGFEWLFRLYQEPGRLWKRYLIDFLKFGCLIWPSVFCHWFEAFRKRSIKSGEAPPPLSHTVASDDTHVLPLPVHLTAGTVAEFTAPPQDASEISFDFSGVKAIDTDGIGTLARAFQQAEAGGRAMALIHMTPHHRMYLSCNFLTGFFKNTFQPAFSYSTTCLSEDITLLRLSGALDSRQAGTLNYRKLLVDIGQRDCIFDMTDLTYIGSSGLMLMLNLSKYILSSGSCFVICSPRQDVKQMFLMTDLQRLFVVLPDTSTAISFIHDVRGERTS